MGRPALSVVSQPSDQDKYQRRIGSGLTPQVISGILRNADIGYMDQWADLLDEIRQNDPHLQCELGKRESQVAGAPIEIRPANSSAKAKKSADYCQRITETLEIPAASLSLSFRGALAHLLGANYHGRAACEVVWARDGRYLRPARVEWIHARRLAYAARSWKLHVWDAASPNTPFSQFPGIPVDDTATFPVGKLIVHTPRVYGTYPTREGLGRCLVWYSAFKRWTVRDWIAFAEWAGRGIRIGKYSTGTDPKSPARATPEDKSALEDALLAMSSSISTIVADTTGIDVIAPPNNQEVHERLSLLCNNEISKAVVGGTLSSDPGDRGARSLGEVQERVRLAIAASDSIAIADTIRRDLFMPAIRERGWPEDLAPTLAILTDPPESLDAFTKRVDTMAGRGLRIPAGYVRDRLGIPDPKDGEETIGGSAASPDPNAPPSATDQKPAADTAKD